MFCTIVIYFYETRLQDSVSEQLFEQCSRAVRVTSVRNRSLGVLRNYSRTVPEVRELFAIGRPGYYTNRAIVSLTFSEIFAKTRDVFRNIPQSTRVL